jgi:two-component system nitrate/nitrite response regulator NarL
LPDGIGEVDRAGADVIIVDSSSCDDDARGRVSELRVQYPETAVVLLVGKDGESLSHFEPSSRIRVLRRTVEPEQLAEAVRRVASGLPDLLVRPRPEGAGGLDEREWQILDRLGRGLTNREIARELWLSEYTIKVCVSTIYRKLQVHSRAEAAHWLHVSGVMPEEAIGA